MAGVYRFPNTLCLKKTEITKHKPGAILARVPNLGPNKSPLEIWVPMSVVHEDSEVYNDHANKQGTLIVYEWWVKKQIFAKALGL